MLDYRTAQRQAVVEKWSAVRNKLMPEEQSEDLIVALENTYKTMLIDDNFGGSVSSPRFMFIMQIIRRLFRNLPKGKLVAELNLLPNMKSFDIKWDPEAVRDLRCASHIDAEILYADVVAKAMIKEIEQMEGTVVMGHMLVHNGYFAMTCG